jgi:hypothetical protein
MGKVPGSIYDKWDISVVICDRYSIAVNQVMVATVKFRSDDFNFTKRTLGSVAYLLAVAIYR